MRNLKNLKIMRNLLLLTLIFIGFSCSTNDVEPINPLDEFVGYYQLESMYHIEYGFEGFNQDDPSFQRISITENDYFNFYLDSEDNDNSVLTGGGVIEYIEFCDFNTYCIKRTSTISWMLLYDNTVISIRDGKYILKEINIEELTDESLKGVLNEESDVVFKKIK